MKFRKIASYLPFVSVLFSCSPVEETVLLIGEFIDIHDAYQTGLLQEEDLYRISYFNNDNRILDESGNEVNLEGEAPILELLDPKVEDKMIEDYTAILENNLDYAEIDFAATPITIAVNCGTDEGYVAVRFFDLLPLPAESEIERFGDSYFEWPYKDGEEVVLYQIKIA